MNKRPLATELSLTLAVIIRGITYTVTDVQIVRAEPDVGIMADYIDGYKLLDDAGNDVDLDALNLTAAEEQTIDDTIYSAMDAWEES